MAIQLKNNMLYMYIYITRELINCATRKLKIINIKLLYTQLTWNSRGTGLNTSCNKYKQHVKIMKQTEQQKSELHYMYRILDNTFVTRKAITDLMALAIFDRRSVFN